MKTQEKILEKAKGLDMSQKSLTILKKKYPAVVYSKLISFLSDWDKDNSESVPSDAYILAYIDKVLACNLYKCDKEFFLRFAFYNYFRRNRVLTIIDRVSEENILFYNCLINHGNWSLYMNLDVSDNVFISILSEIEEYFLSNIKKTNIEYLCTDILFLYCKLAKVKRYDEGKIYAQKYINEVLQRGGTDYMFFKSYVNFIETAIEYNVPVNEVIQLCNDGEYNKFTLLDKLYEERLFMFFELCPCNECHSVSSIYFSEKNQLIINEAKKLGCNMQIHIQCIECEYVYKDGALFVTFYKYRSVNMNKTSLENGKDVKLYGANKEDKLTLIITMNGSILQQLKYKNTNRWIPLNLKKLAKFHIPDIEFMNRFVDCISAYGKNFGNYLLQDCMKYVKNGMFAPPISYNEIMKAQSFKELFAKRYLAVKNWNRNDINIMYATGKVCKYVSIESVNMVLDFMDREMFYNNVNHSSFVVRKNAVRENGVYDFLTMWLNNTFLGSENKVNKVREYLLVHNIIDEDEDVKVWVKGIIDDYVLMCLKSKIKVQLKMKSISKLLRYHENLVLENRNKNIPVVKIPKNSKFAKLRELLPDNFEWINNKKRLLNEAMMQKHCVASYADYINEDICAIYSFVYRPENKRYTLEFVANGTHYAIRQMQSKCNHGHSAEAYEYVQSFLQK